MCSWRQFFLGDVHGAAGWFAGQVPLGLKQLPRDLECDRGLAGAGGQRQQDAPVTFGQCFERRVDGLVLVIAQFPLAAVLSVVKIFGPVDRLI